MPMIPILYVLAAMVYMYGAGATAAKLGPEHTDKNGVRWAALEAMFWPIYWSIHLVLVAPYKAGQRRVEGARPKTLPPPEPPDPEAMAEAQHVIESIVASTEASLTSKIEAAATAKEGEARRIYQVEQLDRAVGLTKRLVHAGHAIVPAPGLAGVRCTLCGACWDAVQFESTEPVTKCIARIAAATSDDPNHYATTLTKVEP